MKFSRAVGFAVVILLALLAILIAQFAQVVGDRSYLDCRLVSDTRLVCVSVDLNTP